MTHTCCPSCRLRFTPAAAAYLTACPECGNAPQTIAGLERTFGFGLIRLDDLPHELPCAAAAAVITLPERDPARS
jgi:hypothetical protein